LVTKETRDRRIDTAEQRARQRSMDRSGFPRRSRTSGGMGL
jgi:hypothetical protein